MKKCVLLMALFSMPTWASVCDLYHPVSLALDKSQEQSQFDNAGVCVSLLDGWEFTSRHLLSFDTNNEAPLIGGDYWNGWLANEADDSNPFLTQQLQNSYLGVGVWMPPDLAARENQMTTEEWLMNHGLKLSLGYGQKQSGIPRVRLDYRWHKLYHANWFMQVEVPF